MVESFSYSPDDISLVEKAKQIAKRDGISYSEYLLSLQKRDVHEQMAFEAATTTVCHDITASTAAVQQSQQQEQSAASSSDNNNNQVLTLVKGCGLPYWNEILEPVDDPHDLNSYITSGKTLAMAAGKRLVEVKAQKRIEGKTRIEQQRRGA